MDASEDTAKDQSHICPEKDESPQQTGGIGAVSSIGNIRSLPEAVLHPSHVATSPLGRSQVAFGPSVHKLPHTAAERLSAYPSTSSSVVQSVIEGKYKHLFDNVLIVDCRFWYEFTGSHIRGAENCGDWKLLKQLMLSRSLTENTFMLLYCEFSQYRVNLLYVS